MKQNIKCEFMACSHKIPNDHQVGVVGVVGDRPMWECSSCGDRSAWSNHHGSYGNVEQKLQDSQ